MRVTALAIGLFFFQTSGGIPRPISYPAIQETHTEEYGNSDWCNSCNSQYACTAMACDPHAKHDVTVWTCADKSMVLLRAENGTRHCVPFDQVTR